jgi:hypothetical protein
MNQNTHNYILELFYEIYEKLKEINSDACITDLEFC